MTPTLLLSRLRWVLVAGLLLAALVCLMLRFVSELHWFSTSFSLSELYAWRKVGLCLAAITFVLLPASVRRWVVVVVGMLLAAVGLGQFMWWLVGGLVVAAVP